MVVVTLSYHRSHDYCVLQWLSLLSSISCGTDGVGDLDEIEM